MPIQYSLICLGVITNQIYFFNVFICVCVTQIVVLCCIGLKIGLRNTTPVSKCIYLTFSTLLARLSIHKNVDCFIGIHCIGAQSVLFFRNVDYLKIHCMYDLFIIIYIVYIWSHQTVHVLN